MNRIPRRRFLQIAAAFGAHCALPPLAAAEAYRWQGSALGAASGVQLIGVNSRRAEALFRQIRDEVARLERIFSVYRPDSAISELNRRGSIQNAPSELREVLIEAQQLSEATAGAFDISVQPLFKYLFYLGTRAPDPERLAELHSLVDYRNICCSETSVRFAKPGMEITMNGIAQGYITDAVRGLLYQAGARNVLVELGETFASGVHASGRAWRIGIQDPQGGEIRKVEELQNLAIATSARAGTRYGRDGRSHLIDCSALERESPYRSVSVIAATAMRADGLSTAAALTVPQKLPALLKKYPGCRAVLIEESGNLTEL